MKEININDYNYELPEERIAQYPLKERDRSKLLIYRDGEISESIFCRIHEYLPDSALLVFNNTRVIRARLMFEKVSGARIEIFCLEPLLPADYALSFRSVYPVEWKCLVGNLKKWKSGTISATFKYGERTCKLVAEKISVEGEACRIKFSWDLRDATFGEILESAGHVPLPPYISRDDETDDSSRYQTIYSLVKGSVAAPTAGLHFSREVFDNLDMKGISTAELTLHVGAGTFQPVKSNNISEHEMHTEHSFITATALEKILSNLGNIIAVGTTSVRTLESLYWLGVKAIVSGKADFSELYLGQWEAYNLKRSVSGVRAIESLLTLMRKINTDVLHIPTRIIIVPGYRFRITDGMITNFHLPKSTLLLLVSAWAGKSWKKIYDYALTNNFRFLSYGDSSLMLRRHSS